MTTLTDAFPSGGEVMRETHILNIAKAFPYAVTDLSAFEDDQISAEPFEAIIYNGNIYQFDVADTTSASDAGATTIVSSGRRYVLNSGFRPGYQVVSRSIDTPPASPVFGDRYVVPDAPMGEWASYAKRIATWSARGWMYQTSTAGMIIWVDDEDRHIHYSSGGNWLDGLGNGSISSASITNDKIKWPMLIVVSDTLADEPGGAVSDGVAYLVSNPASGAFAGKENNLALRVSGAWSFRNAYEGATVYSAQHSTLLSFRAGLWELTIPKPSRSDAVKRTSSGVTGSFEASVNFKILSFFHTPQENERLLIDVVKLGIYCSKEFSASVEYKLAVFVDSESSARCIITDDVTTISGVSEKLGNNGYIGIFADNDWDKSGFIGPHIYLDFADQLEHEIHFVVLAKYQFTSNSFPGSANVDDSIAEIVTERLALS